MSQSARVTSIDNVRDWKEALCVFQAEAGEALCSVDLEIRRFFDWLDEQTKFWENEVRRRDELLVQARNDLLRRKMMKTVAGKEPDTTEQEKVLRRAQAALKHAEEKVAKARKLIPVVRRAVEEYQAPARVMGNMLEGDMPRAVALLEQKLDALDAYINTMAPSTPLSAPKKEGS